MKTVFAQILMMVLITTAHAQSGATKASSKSNSSIVCSVNNTITALPEQAGPGQQISTFFSSLSDTHSWPPRWQCGDWSTFHGWLYIISDMAIGCAYFAIPIILLYFIRQRRQQPPFQFVIGFFIIFILACGLTHFVDAAIFWWPAYRISALLRFITALVSVGTVFTLLRVTPQLMQLKSPAALEDLVSKRTTEINEINVQLQHEIKYRQLSEDKIRQSEANLNAIFESISEGITLLDLQGVIKSFNGKALEMSIQTRGIALKIGDSLFEFIEHSRKDFLHHALGRVATGLCIEYDYSYADDNGDVQWFSIAMNPLREQGTITGLCIVGRDITERKKAEAEILKLNTDLEERVAQRTRDLEAINKELDGFTYSVSHDLRAPLRSIDGYSKILIEDYALKLDQEGMRALQIIIKNVKRMGELIDDLLEFSRLGRSEIHIALINMDSLVRDVIVDLHAGGITIPDQLHIENLKPAHGDYSLIKQVWFNLISNAIKYSGKKTNPVIEIGTTEAGDKIIYYVKDNGAGFDMQYYHKLFGVFQRLHKQDEFTGTGVGLALVQRIIIRHKGLVWADAKPNEGATFYFSL